MILATTLRRALRLALVGAVLGWTLGCRAEAPADCPPVAATLTADQAKAAMSVARDHGFLWRISKGGHGSYLYGTIHATRLEWLFPGPKVVDAVRRSDAVALEIDLSDPDMLRRLTAASPQPDAAQMSPGGGRASAAPLRKALPQPLLDRLQRRMTSECLTDPRFAKMNPGLQVAALTVLAARRDGIDPSYAVDVMLAGFGRAAQKAMHSLETPEAQLAALGMGSADDGAALIESALDDLDSNRVRPLLNRVNEVWAAGDLAELERYREWCECAKTPAAQRLMTRILEERNPGLADAIDALHSSGRRVFAAVGSLHLIGPLGLPALLKQRGYQVEAVAFGR
ncbi:MAG: TraB/GumN family protein [Pseudomonadota bacterium]|nr:TraB/GumN family protein [Pseudomonadota bacterium]